MRDWLIIMNIVWHNSLLTVTLSVLNINININIVWHNSSLLTVSISISISILYNTTLSLQSHSPLAGALHRVGGGLTQGTAGRWRGNSWSTPNHPGGEGRWTMAGDTDSMVVMVMVLDTLCPRPPPSTPSYTSSLPTPTRPRLCPARPLWPRLLPSSLSLPWRTPGHSWTCPRRSR